MNSSQPDTPSDAELVRNVTTGDHISFDLLVSRYAPAVRGVALHYSRNVADADDLVQGAFLQAYEKLYQLREPERFAGWMRGIAVNVSLMWLRSRKPATDSLDETSAAQIPDRHPTPDQDLEALELKETVHALLDQLGEGERLATRLFYLEELSIKEIGAFLGISVAAVKSRLYKARQKLQTEARRTMSKQPDTPKSIPIRPDEGYLHIHEKGYAFLRPKIGDESDPKDIYVSHSQVHRFAMQEKDHIDVEVRPPKNENEKYDAVIRIMKINGRDTSVEGPLDIVEAGYGFLRQNEDGTPSEADIYLTRQQIDQYALDAGDHVTATARQPTGDVERFFAAVQIHAVNGGAVKCQMTRDRPSPKGYGPAGK